MYHCHIHFYFIGYSCREFEIIKKMPPNLHFTHEFMESEVVNEALAGKADIIIANLCGVEEIEICETLIASKDDKTELILIAEKEQMDLLADVLPEIRDIWIAPMTEDEIRFRFLRWQQIFQMSKDFWQVGQYLETMMNSTPNLIWYKDKDGIHEKVNDSFCQTVRKTKQQVEGRGHAYIWDVEEDDPACKESEREVMEKRKTCIAEEIIKTGEGMKTLTTYKSPLYDIDGSVMGTVGVGIDVTKERAYEQEIIRKNHTLETIFMSLDCGIMSHSMDGKEVININRAALKILGYDSLEEMMTDNFDMVASSVMDEDKQSLKTSIKELKETGDSVNVVYRVLHKDGEIRHVMGNIKLVEENGEQFYQRFLLDCTAQKRLEERNEKLQMEMIQSLSIDYTLVCFFDLDTDDGILLRLTDEENHLFGSAFNGKISLKECMELYIQMCVYEEDKNMMRTAVSADRIREELLEKKQYYVNYRTMNDGRMEYYQMKVVRAGIWEESFGIVLGLCNVDEETRAEMEQRGMLEDALLQAQNASKAKSVFLSNMSHDIRTPMNAIVGFTALAITHIDNSEQVEEYLKKIMTSGNHLLSLINDVLDMSRIESGKMHLDIKPCSLPDILHGLRNIVQADIYAKQLELYIDTVDVIDEDIYCDKLRLNQVLLNLISNAIKYTQAGGIVSMRIMEKAGAPAGYANYEFYIKDTGIGMSEEFVSRIFEPFERERTSTISGIQGTGLGMAITKNIVDMMNGTITVKSEQGVGSEFIVNFTFRLHSGSSQSQEIPELKNCRALVVDDDYNTCDSVTYMLGQIGMRAEWTLSGKEAVLRTHQAVTRGDNYAVYIIDWMLPDMNGIEVTRRIRKEMGEDVPVIVLTAYDWADIEEEAKEAGVTAFCSKPLFLSELRSCLISIVDSEEEVLKDSDREIKKIHTGRILLAEDIELNQEIAVTILEEAGFTVEVAENGSIAYEMVKKSEPGHYQIVLMDVQMPVMNGYEATKAIRGLDNPKLASIPILAMTANAFEEDKQEALKCGMNGHIAKPIDVDCLFGALNKILKSE